MKRFQFGLSALALLAFSVPALAGIHKFATSTSHHLEEVSEGLHHYMHAGGGFPSSYGAHGMDDAAAAAHDALHDFNNGSATEAEVLAAVDAANDAFDNMRTQFRANNVWADKTAKKMYDEIHKTLVKLNAYTN